MANVYGFTFVFRKADGKFSKQFKTYVGCLRAASKVYPDDTDRYIFKINGGLITPVLS